MGGEVNAAGDPEGSGTLEYPGNDEFLRQFYEGDFVNKKAHGKGMMRWNQGDKYEGDWQEGLRHGQGTYFSKTNGFKYEGQYAKDKKHGKGKYTYPNGDIYNGQWKEGVRHGEGKLVKADGEERTENWKEGKLINFNITKEK